MKNSSSITLIIVSIGIFFFAIDPQYKSLQELNKVKAENEKMMVKAEELRAKRTVLETRYNNISEEDREKLNKVMPETVDNVRLILDIDRIASRYGIVLRGITVSGNFDTADNKNKIVDKTDVKQGVISLGFSLNAPYDVFKSFMIDLEKSLRVVDVTDMTISANDQSNVYDYSVKLNTYWLR